TNTIGNTTTLTNSGTLLDTGTLTNAGKITGTGKFILDPTTFTNSGYVGLTVTLAGTGDVLDNKSIGTIKVAGTAIYATGSAAIIDNFGMIEGASYGIALNAGGTITNGATNATGALISASVGIGVLAQNDAATVANYGTITGNGSSGFGVDLENGGSVRNTGTAALISARYGILIRSGPFTLTNSGTIAGLVNAVFA